MYTLVPLQSVPEVLGSPYDQILFGLVLAGVALLVLRLLLDVAWKIVALAAIGVAVVGGASTMGFL